MEAQLNMIDFITNFTRGFINIQLKEQEKNFNERFLEQDRKYERFLEQNIKLERISNVAMNAEITIPPFAGEQQYTTSLNTKNIHLPLYLLKEHLHKFYQINTLHLNLRGGCQPYDKTWNIFQLELELLPQNLTITEIIIAEAGVGSYLLGGGGGVFPENPLGVLEWMFIKFPNIISLNISPSVLMPQNIQNLIQLLNKSKRNIKLQQLVISTLNPPGYCGEKDELIKCCKRLMINLII